MMRKVVVLVILLLANNLHATPPDSIRADQIRDLFWQLQQQAVLQPTIIGQFQDEAKKAGKGYDSWLLEDFFYEVGRLVYIYERDRVLQASSGQVQTGFLISESQKQAIMAANWEASPYSYRLVDSDKFKVKPSEYNPADDMYPLLPTHETISRQLTRLADICQGAGLISSGTAESLRHFLAKGEVCRSFAGWVFMANEAKTARFFPLRKADQSATLDRLQTAGLLPAAQRDSLFQLLETQTLSFRDLTGRMKRSGVLPQVPVTLSATSFIQQFLAPVVRQIPGFSPTPITVSIQLSRSAPSYKLYFVTLSFMVSNTIVKRSTYYTLPAISAIGSPEALFKEKVVEDIMLLNIFNQHLSAVRSPYRVVWLKENEAVAAFAVMAEAEWAILAKSDPYLSGVSQMFSWSSDFTPAGRLKFFNEMQAKGMLPTLEAEEFEQAKSSLYHLELTSSRGLLENIPYLLIYDRGDFGGEGAAAELLEDLALSTRGAFAVDTFFESIIYDWFEEKDSTTVTLVVKGKNHFHTFAFADKENWTDHWMTWVNRLLLESGSQQKMYRLQRVEPVLPEHWSDYDPNNQAPYFFYLCATSLQMDWLSKRLPHPEWKVVE